MNLSLPLTIILYSTHVLHVLGQENREVITGPCGTSLLPLDVPRGTKSLPVHSLSDLSKEISKMPINTLSHATPTSVGLRLGYTASPINLATCLTVLAYYLCERLSSLWLCRPVHLSVPLVLPNQWGQGIN